MKVAEVLEWVVLMVRSGAIIEERMAWRMIVYSRCLKTRSETCGLE